MYGIYGIYGLAPKADKRDTLHFTTAPVQPTEKLCLPFCARRLPKVNLSPSLRRAWYPIGPLYQPHVAPASHEAEELQRCAFSFFFQDFF